VRTRATGSTRVGRRARLGKRSSRRHRAAHRVRRRMRFGDRVALGDGTAGRTGRTLLAAVAKHAIVSCVCNNESVTVCRIEGQIVRINSACTRWIVTSPSVEVRLANDEVGRRSVAGTACEGRLVVEYENSVVVNVSDKQQVSCVVDGDAIGISNSGLRESIRARGEIDLAQNGVGVGGVGFGGGVGEDHHSEVVVVRHEESPGAVDDDLVRIAN